MADEQSGETIAVDVNEDKFADVMPVAEKADDDAAVDESEKPATEEDNSEEGRKHRRGGFQKKIAKKDAEIAELKAALAQRDGQSEAKESSGTESAGQKPTPDKFQSYDEYVEALADFKAEEKVSKALQKRDAESKNRTVAEAWEGKQAEARKVYADYDEVIEDHDTPPNRQLATALLESDLGAEVAYYLSKNPDEFEKLNGDMSPIRLGKEFGRIEMIIEGKKQGAVVKTVKSPPPPIAPLKSAGSTAIREPHNMSIRELDKWFR